MDWNTLTQAALEVLKPRSVSPSVEAGGVAAALVTRQGNVYRGVCLDTSCSLGFCAEHAAVAAMLTAGEDEPEGIAAVGVDGKVWPPCGRCRELLHQINPACRVLLPGGQDVPVRELLPHAWISSNNEEETV